MAGLDGFEEIWTGLRWLIIRNPYEAGQLVPGKQQTYALKTADFMALGLPEFVVSYSLINVETRVLEIIDVLPATTSGAELAQTA